MKKPHKKDKSDILCILHKEDFSLNDRLFLQTYRALNDLVCVCVVGGVEGRGI